MNFQHTMFTNLDSPKTDKKVLAEVCVRSSVLIYFDVCLL